MGFLPENPKAEFEKLLGDLYQLYRTTPDQQLLSDRLLTVLMAITGIFDQEVEVDDGQAKIWQECGFVESDSGRFLLRKGEGRLIHNHFKLLYITRLQLKKSNKKTSIAEPDFKPKISSVTSQLAEEQRIKLGITDPSVKIDIVKVLLNPEKNIRKNQRIEMIKKQKLEAEQKDETFKPKINKRPNNMVESKTNGSKHLDLYNQALAKHDQKQLTLEELDFIRSKKECKFKPKINKKAYVSNQAKDLKEFYGFEKFKERLAKAREEAEFKKKMTERSNFGVTGSIKNAKKQVRSGKVLGSNVATVFVNNPEATKFKGFGGRDSA